jgi:NTP pyrophosphatase (non-canonical NTP hydrolase)
MMAKYANGYEAMKGDRVRRVIGVPLGSIWDVEDMDSEGDIVCDGDLWYAKDFDLVARADGSLPGEGRSVDVLLADYRQGTFKPYCHKSEASGAMTIYFSGDADYSERLTDEVTLYRSIKTNEIVGCRVPALPNSDTERLAAERDEARESLRSANIAKDGYITAIRLAAGHVAKIKGDDIGHGTPIDMAVAIVCDELAKARDALDAISQSQADAYDEFVQSRKSQASVLPTQEATDALHGSIGIITEGGELLDAMKKHLYYGRDFDRVNAIEELGDIEFYASVLRHSLGVTRDEVLRINVAKLERRYKERFTAAESVNRDTDAERGIMEHELQDLKGGE